MKTKEIRDLIEFLASTGLNEVNIETEELKLSVKRDADVKTQIVESIAQVPAGVAPLAAAPAVVESTPADSPASNAIEVKSPMIGTFYRSQNPETPVFVSVGDKITVGQTVCIVEAMKLFNEIETEVSGTIIKILVDDASPVEYDQPLFLVDPS